MRILSLCLFVCLSVYGFAQSVTHGPIIGGVTDSSCRVFVRTSAATAFTLELSSSSSFSTIAASANGNTDPALDNTAIIEMSGLISNKKYYARINIGGNPSGDISRFETFYAQGAAPHQVFLTGSCIKGLTDTDSAIFVQAATENAKAFISLGNWGYPDADSACFYIYYGAPPTSWAKSFASVQSSYKQRYTSSNSSSFIKSFALDYTYDDHDYMNEKAGKFELLGYHLNIFDGIVGAPNSWSQPVQARLNLIQGYRQMFPGYNLVDTTEGLYHSFRSGNAEFFVLDVRSMKGGTLRVDTSGSSSHWLYRPVANSYMLGPNQTNWLENALSTSTATWKFIVTAVPFNIGNRFALDTLIKLGNATSPYWHPNLPCYPFPIPNACYAATNNFADMWAGYKADADTVLNYVFANNIKNVYVLSGHTGTVGLDDGVNAGLPELMSGNMKLTNSQDALLFQKFMGFSVWDLGGSGLCGQSNLNTTYGKVEVFGDDSLRLSAIDQTGTEVTGYNFYANAAYKYNPNYLAHRLPTAVNDVVSMLENDTTTISVLTNDININNDSLYTNLLSNPAHGTVTVNSNNTLTYLPDTGYFGVDTFSYTACNRLNAQCQNCSSAKVTVSVSQVTAITELGNNVRLRVYPNPAENILFVEILNSTEPFEMVLINPLGQQLLSRDFTGKASLDISALPAGNYYYTLVNKANGTIKNGKIAVAR
ncbi:MAG: hypothetical protein JWO06_3341 [Bacteroidota bacterium]|nr:hypothetical protein [Bacteroidota bacterium]